MNTPLERSGQSFAATELPELVSVLDEPPVTSRVPVINGIITSHDYHVTPEHKQPCELRYKQIGRYASASLLEMPESAELPIAVDGARGSFIGIPLDALLVIHRGLRYQSFARSQEAGNWHDIRAGYSNNRYFHNVIKTAYQRKLSQQLAPANT